VDDRPSARRPRNADALVTGSLADRCRPVCVCVPTYNEAENIGTLVAALLDVFDRFSIDGRVLVIDDASSDGTGDVVDRIARRERRVRVIHRASKDGIGPAYLAGFSRALAEGAELVIEMDADLSHAPEAVPSLLVAARESDVVIGSRYVAGGGVVRWGPVRKAISRAGCFYARTVLGVHVRDLTGGFKCFRRSALEAVLAQDLHGNGYVFQIETTYRALLDGFRVTEVPISFTERTKGRSKMSARIVFEAAWLVPWLRFATARRRRRSVRALASVGDAASAPHVGERVG
jgi:dolichol-phosphate mannosyltransferase